ncbi:MAG: hypothetical protein WBG71_07325 [Leeuwenhoekiella sp.]
MSKQDNSRILIIIIGVLSLVLVAMGFLTFRFYNAVNEDEGNAIQEKLVMREELRDLRNQYSKEMEVSAGLRNELQQAKRHIDSLLTDLGQLETTTTNLAQYRAEIRMLRNQNTALRRKADSIIQINKKLTQETELAQVEITRSRRSQDSLARANARLKEDLEAVNAPVIVIQSGGGVILRRSGKRLASDRADRIDRIEICLEIENSPYADNIGGYAFIQVTDPNNNVLGARETAVSANANVLYSEALELAALAQGVQPCTLITPFNDRFLVGDYQIYAIVNGKRVAETTITLN